MKPEVQPKRPKTPPPEAIPVEPPLFSAEGLRRNRSLFIGIGVALGIALLMIAGVGVRSYVVASANVKGWETYATTRANLSIAAGPPPGTTKSPEETVRDIESALPSIRGTTAEPWVLFDLGNAHFAAGDAQKARDVYSDLKARFKDHVLVDKGASYHGTSKVDTAIEDCDSEMLWMKERARPQPKASTSSVAPGATPDTPAPGTAVDAPGNHAPEAEKK